MTSKKKYRSCRQSPLEFKDVEMQKWWLNLFDEMEQIHFKERHKIGSVISEVVARRTYDVLKPIFGLEQHKEAKTTAEGEEGESPPEEDIPTPSDFRSLGRTSVSEDTEVDQSEEHAEEWMDDEDDWDYEMEEEDLDEEEEEDEDDQILPEEEIKSNTTLEGSSEVSSLFVEAGFPHFGDAELEEPYTNPYLTFLKSPKVKAAVWRPMKDPIPTGLDEPDPNLDLQEKAALVTYLLSKEFYDWFKSIGGTEVHTFSDRVLAELFCVGFDQLAAHALCSRMKEMPSVPTEVAAETNIKKADYRKALKREIERDSRAEKIPRRTYAFGNTIKYPDRWVPPHNEADNWLKCFRVRSEIASFSMVWQGITHMSSTKAFVHYLKERPLLPRPEYLKEQHMFDVKIRRRSVAVDSRPNSPVKARGDRASSVGVASTPSDTHVDGGSSSSSSADGYESDLNLAKYGIA